MGKLLRFKVPDSRVKPLSAGQNAFRLTDNDMAIFDSFAKEQVDIAGTEVDYYSIRILKSKRDPVYDEPTKRSWTKPFRMTAWVSWASSAPTVGEEGFRVLFQAQAWLPRAEVERVRCPVPTEGDIIRYWKSEYFNTDATGGEKITGAGYYFDVINVDNDGHVYDTSSFVGYRLDIRRRSEYGSERLVDP